MVPGQVTFLEGICRGPIGQLLLNYQAVFSHLHGCHVIEGPGSSRQCGVSRPAPTLPTPYSRPIGVIPRGGVGGKGQVLSEVLEQVLELPKHAIISVMGLSLHTHPRWVRPWCSVVAERNRGGREMINHPQLSP